MRIAEVFDEETTRVDELNREIDAKRHEIKRLDYREHHYLNMLGAEEDDEVTGSLIHVLASMPKTQASQTIPHDVANKLDDLTYNNGIPKFEIKGVLYLSVGQEDFAIKLPLPIGLDERLDRYFAIGKKRLAVEKRLDTLNNEMALLVKEKHRLEKKIFSPKKVTQLAKSQIPQVIQPNRTKSKISNPYFRGTEARYAGPAEGFNWDRILQNYLEIRRTLNSVGGMPLTVYMGKWAGVAQNIVAVTPKLDFVYYKYDGGPGSGQSWCYVDGQKMQLSQFLGMSLKQRQELLRP